MEKFWTLIFICICQCTYSQRVEYNVTEEPINLIPGNIESKASNTEKINEFILNASPDKPISLYFPSGNYYFYYIRMYGINGNMDNIEVRGDGIGRSVLYMEDSSKTQHGVFRLSQVKHGYFHDFTINGSLSEEEGGILLRDYVRNSKFERIEVKEAAELSFVLLGGHTQYIEVNDCRVIDQRKWIDGKSMAMFLAGEGAHHIYFNRCYTYSSVSAADHFDSDNAQFIYYYQCVAEGSGKVGGAGFWNEGEKNQKSISYYSECQTINTGGGLGIAENSHVYATNMYFINSSRLGWTVWQHGSRSNSFLSLKESTFVDNYSLAPDNSKFDPMKLKKGGIHLESPAHIESCKFIYNTDTGIDNYDISIYGFRNSPDPKSKIVIENCEFSKGIYFFDANDKKNYTIGELQIVSNTFKDLSTLKFDYIIRSTNIRVSDNSFINSQVKLAGISNIDFIGNQFISDRGGFPFAVGIFPVYGILRDNTFVGYGDLVADDKLNLFNMKDMETNVIR